MASQKPRGESASRGGCQMTLEPSHTEVITNFGQKQLRGRGGKPSVGRKLMGAPNDYKSTWYIVFYERKIKI